MPLRQREVVEVVRRGDLDRARAEIRLDIVVGDDRDQPVDDRQAAALPHEVPVALVARVHRHRAVTEDRFGAGGGDGDEAAAVLERIAEVPHIAVDLAIFDFEVTDRGAELRVPVDQPLVAVEQPLVIQVDEHLGHRRRKTGVHGEALVRPVAACAQPPELAGNCAAAGRLPVPHRLHERLAPQLLPRRRLRAFGELAFDHHLRCDAGVIGADHPQCIVALQPVIADQHVLQRIVERMADVQRAGHIGRWDDDGKRPGIGPRRAERSARLPARIQPRLDLGRVEGLVDDGHGLRSSGGGARGHSPTCSVGGARSALGQPHDLLARQPLDDLGQMGIKPCLQLRLEHRADQRFDRRVGRR